MLWKVKSSVETWQTLVLDVAITSDVGCVRSNNEDNAIYFNPNRNNQLGPVDVLVIVADGMGGHAAGEVASRMAVDHISKAYFENGRKVKKKLITSLESANGIIFEAARKDEGLSGMGTTCVVLAFSEGQAYAAHVGDSRIYHFRAGQITSMTKDHSLVAELLRNGLISKAEAESHPDRNIVLRALGTKSEVEVSLSSRSVLINSGDRFILSTDGLHDLVKDDEIRDAVAVHSPHEACEQLVELAKNRGGYDNITVAVVACERSSGKPRNVRDTRGV